MAVDGLGVGMLPRALVQAELAAGTLIELFADWHPAPLDFYARFNVTRAPRHVRAAGDIAVTLAAQHGWLATED